MVLILAVCFTLQAGEVHMIDMASTDLARVSIKPPTGVFHVDCGLRRRFHSSRAVFFAYR